MKTPNALTRLILPILIGSSALSLTRCATHSPTIVTREIRPPSVLLEPCRKPEAGRLETNRDLARLASELAYSLDVCAAQIEALRVYFDVTSGNP